MLKKINPVEAALNAEMDEQFKATRNMLISCKK